MKISKLAKLTLPIFLCSLFSTTQAQKASTNHPFSWKESKDQWYMSKDYTFKYASDDLSGMTSKGQVAEKATVGHGPVCSNTCNETTEPGACTERLMKEKFKEVELPGITFPNGYSGVEYVTFDILTNGKVNSYQVVKQAVLCKPCIQAAVNEVAALDEWHPAIQDGRIVKSTVVVPVYFKTGAAHQSN
ncbi:MAG: energy transducer TonB [Saprospiraceae bacterium]